MVHENDPIRLDKEEDVVNDQENPFVKQENVSYYQITVVMIVVVLMTIENSLDFPTTMLIHPATAYVDLKIDPEYWLPVKQILHLPKKSIAIQMFTD